MDPDRLRRTFDQNAELYDRARPGYPAELFEDLATEAGLRAGSRILEIGCGTGQATVPLAERGYEIVCVELGAELAAVARRKLARFPSVEVAIAPFENWAPPAAGLRRGRLRQRLPLDRCRDSRDEVGRCAEARRRPGHHLNPSRGGRR